MNTRNGGALRNPGLSLSRHRRCCWTAFEAGTEGEKSSAAPSRERMCDSADECSSEISLSDGTRTVERGTGGALAVKWGSVWGSGTGA